MNTVMELSEKIENNMVKFGKWKWETVESINHITPYFPTINPIPLHYFREIIYWKVLTTVGSFERRENLFINSDGIITSCTTYDSFPSWSAYTIFDINALHGIIYHKFLDRHWYSERRIHLSLAPSTYYFRQIFACASARDSRPQTL